MKNFGHGLNKVGLCADMALVQQEAMMRVESTGTEALSVAGITAGAAPGAVAQSQGKTEQPTPQDTAALSSSSLAVPSLTAQALSTAEARAAKVEALRQAIVSASYIIDPALVADAMISQGF